MDGYQCRFIAGCNVLIDLEPKASSLNLLPRLDDREGQRMLLG